jgi:transcriptional regulator with XRE-family HTH domain
MRKIREVLRLRHACGLSERRIALAIGLSRSTISDYLKRAGNAGIAWPVAAEIDDAALERRLFPSMDLAIEAARPLPDWNSVFKELKRRGVTLQLLWAEYRGEHGDGYCYSHFCECYREWLKTVSPTMRQTQAPRYFEWVALRLSAEGPAHRRLPPCSGPSRTSLRRAARVLDRPCARRRGKPAVGAEVSLRRGRTKVRVEARGWAPAWAGASETVDRRSHPMGQQVTHSK